MTVSVDVVVSFVVVIHGRSKGIRSGPSSLIVLQSFEKNDDTGGLKLKPFQFLLFSVL